MMSTNAILNLESEPSMAPASHDNWWEAVVARDPNHDGQFFFAVATTGVYCRPSCPAKRPRRDNVTFFRRPEAAEKAGYRACLRCKPKATAGNPQITMVSDEAYEDLVFEGEHISIASLPGMQERTLTCFTFSKSYS